LTGEPPTENIDGCEFTSHGSDILVPPHIRPVFRQHRPTEWVNLHLPANLEARALEAEVKPANPGEEATHRHSNPLPP